MNVEEFFPLLELGEQGDRSLQVLRTRAGIVLKILKRGGTGLGGDRSRVFLVLGQLGIDILRNIGKWCVRISRPEKVIRREVKTFLRFSR